MKRLLIFLFWCPLYLNAQNTDTLIFLNEITYSGDYEKQLIGQYFIDRNGTFDLFTIAGTSVSEGDVKVYHQQYNEKLALIKAQALKAKTNPKKVKAVFKSTHDSYLKKYELINHFPEIFQTGNYNCVSASALYAMIFDELQIPYVIKETPTHVYLVAYPEAEKILVETTDPTAQYLMLSDKFKSEYINQLRKNKLISEEEYKNFSTAYLFDKYYFSKDDISMAQLIGIQYMNDAIYLANQNKIEGALQQAEKAYLFYPSERISYLVSSLMREVLVSQDYSDARYISILARLARQVPNLVSQEDITGEFVRITERHLINKSNPIYYDKISAELISKLNDDSLRKEVSYIYHFERGRVLYTQTKVNHAVEQLEKAFILKPDNLDIQALFVAAIGSSLENNADLREVNDKLAFYEKNHTQLLENNLFLTMRLNVYLGLMGENFEQGKASEAEKFKKLFETNYLKENAERVSLRLVTYAYSAAGSYYFRKNNNALARAAFKRGLEYAPRSMELVRRLEMVN